MTASLDQLIESVFQMRDLSRVESAELLSALMSGRFTDDRVKQLLLAWAAKGETVEEIVGAAGVMRRCVTPIACAAPAAIDTCGTGGDGISTFNVSTAAAVVAAAAGAVVAKHGNRSNSRRSGSAEVLAEMGVDIEAPPATVEHCLRRVGIAFLFAPRLHPAMGRVAEIRRKIGRPTIFNLLGPLTNPAGVRRQIIGVPRPNLLHTLAEALRELGAAQAIVVHGHDGLCDFSITGESCFVELRGGSIGERAVSPEDVGLTPGSLDDLRVTGPAESAAVIRAVFDGEQSARRDHTLLNAAAALVVAGVASDLADGVRRAALVIDSGAARTILDRLVRESKWRQGHSFERGPSA